MKQKYVQFHTEKSYRQTLEIFKKEKLEIVFQSNRCTINIEDLSIEELVSHLETKKKDEKQWNDFVNHARERFDIFVEYLVDFKKQTKEFVKLYRNDPKSYNASEKYEQFMMAKKKLRGCHIFHSNEISGISWYGTFLSMMNTLLPLEQEIYCSCIIAKKEKSLVRYVSFLRDPIVTITGPKPNLLKLTLEKKF